MQLLRALETYIPLAEIFAYGRFYEKEDTAFLDSSLENELGRYSILGLKPYLKLVKGEKFTVNGVESEIGFEEYVRTYLKEHRQENPTELPLTAGAIGYFSYEYGRKKEDVKTRHKNGVDMPDAVLVFYDVFLIEDTREKVLYTVANGESVEPEKALAEVEELVRGAAGLAGDNAGCVIENVNTGEAFRLRENQIVVEKSGSREDSALADLVCDETDSMADPKQAHAVSGNAYTDSENRGDGLVEETPIPHVSHPHLKITPDFTHEDYKGAIDRMIQYIIEGDIYIANMTRQLTIESPKAPYEVFRTLRKNNPSPFGGFFNYGNFQVVAASPERFLKVKDHHIVTRPIKGTRKRGETPEEDALLRAELEASEKDKSELLMIVDLERNDLNRVSMPGSVKVTELFTVEEYATVFHLISNVEGDLKPELTVMDLIEAAFPGGSITGAPKLRAMEIIDELEHSSRNLYTGSMGYLSLSGDCDLNIVIRTAVYQDGVYHLGVGGGITCESDLEFEYEETLQKAKALLQAME